MKLSALAHLPQKEIFGKEKLQVSMLDNLNGQKGYYIERNILTGERERSGKVAV